VDWSNSSLLEEYIAKGLLAEADGPFVFIGYGSNISI
jgi:hypothetical protein